MIRVLLTAAAATFATAVCGSHAEAASSQPTRGMSYTSRTYQENSSANRQATGAARAFAPVKSNKK